MHIGTPLYAICLSDALFPLRRIARRDARAYIYLLWHADLRAYAQRSDTIHDNATTTGDVRLSPKQRPNRFCIIVATVASSARQAGASVSR